MLLAILVPVFYRLFLENLCACRNLDRKKGEDKERHELGSIFNLTKCIYLLDETDRGLWNVYLSFILNLLFLMKAFSKAERWPDLKRSICMERYFLDNL